MSCVASNGSVVDDTQCDTLQAPAIEQQCAVAESVCWGAAATAPDDDVNGVCDVTSASCVCRTGWSGATCQTAPSISSVVTGASSFASRRGAG